MAIFSLTEDAKGKSLSLFYADGDSETISETHVSFKKVVNLLINENPSDDEIRELTRVRETLKRKLTALSERVSVDGTTVYFDGDPINGTLADVIKRMFEEGKTLDFKPLVNFLEKASTNPSLKSIEDLYRWVSKGDLVIDPDGDIVAYKAVRVDENGVSTSIHQGPAFVNGEEFNGHVPNKPGTVISMARSLVVDDPHVGCSVGLHAGTYDYARTFQKWNSRYHTRLILVKINPRDVVSVPHDEEDRKMRVARYTVLSEIEERLADPIFISEEAFPVTDEDETEEDYYDDLDIDDDYFDDDDDEWDEDEDLSSEEDWESYAEWEKALMDPQRYEEELEERRLAELAEKLKAEKEAAEEQSPQPFQLRKPASPASPVSDGLRDALGRFKKGAGAIMKRDSKGRFIS